MKFNGLHSINKAQRLYVLNEGKGFSCYGFDFLDEKARKLAIELGDTWKEHKGTKKAYKHYVALVRKAYARNRATGWRSTAELTTQLIGLERKRIEVIDKYDERRRFIVGKSTGFIPCHLEILRSNSSGGMAVMGAPFKSVKILN